MAEAPKLDEIKQRILGALDDYAARQPEDGETWESWFHAAFDLAREKISTLLALVGERETLPEEVTGCLGRLDWIVKSELIEKPWREAIVEAASLLRRWPQSQTPADAVLAEAWEPIETAPKGNGDEGPSILLFGPMMPNYKRPYYIENSRWYRTSWTITWMDGHLPPTHWQPLPAPPRGTP